MSECYSLSAFDKSKYLCRIKKIQNVHLNNDLWKKLLWLPSALSAFGHLDFLMPGPLYYHESSKPVHAALDYWSLHIILGQRA